MDASKFNLAEAVSNSDGKTSGSGLIGVFIGFIGGLCFLLAVAVTLFKDKDSAFGTTVIMQSVIIIGIAAGLLGWRNAIAGKSASSLTAPATQN